MSSWQIRHWRLRSVLNGDVTWTTIETGTEVRGPLPVQDAIVGLHAQMFDIKTRRLVVSEGAAYIVGRISYCVADDLDGDRVDARVRRSRGDYAELNGS